ncbi:EAL domain-containing protein [Erwinia oleae]|uniref:EAL domain-containing protein n=1 Tax=Erwinia oleae TaxID=796334 RepID=UPI0005500230|nr:EAL domain-containing protein [Erwinia oleae]
MKIYLEADYKSYTAFYPLYSFDGRLLAVELLTHFSHSTANVAIPYDMLLPQLNEAQRVALFQNQINCVEKHQAFFRQHNVNVAINIDELLAKAILENEMLLHKMAALEMILLEISETFIGMKQAKGNDLLSGLSEKFALSLKNYGSGKAPSTAIYDNLFWQIKFDKGFIQHNFNRLSFKPFIGSVIENIKPHCQQIIVQGIDDLAALEKIRRFAFSGIQSSLFSFAGEETLDALLQPPAILIEPPTQ